MATRTKRLNFDIEGGGPPVYMDIATDEAGNWRTSLEEGSMIGVISLAASMKRIADKLNDIEVDLSDIKRNTDR